jgi:hypothetical protein
LDVILTKIAAVVTTRTGTRTRTRTSTRTGSEVGEKRGIDSRETAYVVANGTWNGLLEQVRRIHDRRAVADHV